MRGHHEAMPILRDAAGQRSRRRRNRERWKQEPNILQPLLSGWGIHRQRLHCRTDAGHRRASHEEARVQLADAEDGAIADSSVGSLETARLAKRTVRSSTRTLIRMRPLSPALDLDCVGAYGINCLEELLKIKKTGRSDNFDSHRSAPQTPTLDSVVWFADFRSHQGPGA